MICERGGCGGGKPDPHPGVALAMLFGVSAVLVLMRFAGTLIQ